MARSKSTFRVVSFIVSVALMLSVLLFAALAAVFPEASGTDVESDGSLHVDCSNSSDGYVMVRTDGDGKKYKLRIFYGDYSSTYDLEPGADFAVFPLQYGSGDYTFTLFKNVKGNKYSDDGTVKVSASLYSEYAAYLCPNPYVNYTADSGCIAMADELCAGLSSDKEKFTAISEYVGANFQYDFVEAVSVQPGQLPDVERCWELKMGICQDLSAMTCAMLRSQGVVSRLMIGYANDNYHAWCMVNVDGEDILFDPTDAVGALPGKCKYTVERYY